MPQPTNDSLSDRLQAFRERVYWEIKRKLYSGRREDPEVRIEIQVDEDVFNESLGRGCHENSDPENSDLRPQT